MGILYSAMLEDVVSHIKGVFDSAGQAKVVHGAHVGTFTEQDVMKLANRCPQILTVCHGLSLDDFASSGRVDYTSFVLTRLSNINPKGYQMLDLLNILMYALKEMDLDWAVNSPESVRAKSLYSGKLKDVGANLWSVSWHLPVRGIGIQGLEMFENLPEFDSYKGTLENGGREVDELYQGGL